jgi:hydroxymethylglutaryl-CoA lyase
MAIANAFAGLEMGVTRFDSSVAGIGGCPFAGHTGAAGNVCTEDLVFMCNELGIKTGIDLDALIECARLAEDVVGHPLPGSVMKGGTLQKLSGLSATSLPAWQQGTGNSERRLRLAQNLPNAVRRYHDARSPT